MKLVSTTAGYGGKRSAPKRAVLHSALSTRVVQGAGSNPIVAPAFSPNVPAAQADFALPARAALAKINTWLPFEGDPRHLAQLFGNCETGLVQLRFEHLYASNANNKDLYKDNKHTYAYIYIYIYTVYTCMHTHPKECAVRRLRTRMFVCILP